MFLFLKGHGTLVVDSGLTVDDAKQLIQRKHGVPRGAQILIFNGRQLRDSATLAESGLSDDSTVHLCFRLRGGKGGFGALLRGAGRAAQTDNVDACRDLSGRRLRHINAEKKMKEWIEKAPQRERERAEKEAARMAAKEAERQAKKEVDITEFRQNQEDAMKGLSSALYESLKAKPVKRSGLHMPEMRNVKRRRMGSPSIEFSEDEDSLESHSDNEDLIRPVAAQLVSESRIGVIQPAHSSETSDQEALQPPSIRGPAISQEEVHSKVHSQVGSVVMVATGAASVSVETVGDAERGQSVCEQAATSRATVAVPAPIDLSAFATPQALEVLGLHPLKQELMRYGLKCGGTLAERAARLFLLKSSPLGQLEKKHFAKNHSPR
eukprot:jgi/Botrbrau1/16544/Bobra.0256s0003.1